MDAPRWSRVDSGDQAITVIQGPHEGKTGWLIEECKDYLKVQFHRTELPYKIWKKDTLEFASLPKNSTANKEKDLQEIFLLLPFLDPEIIKVVYEAKQDKEATIDELLHSSTVSQLGNEKSKENRQAKEKLESERKQELERKKMEEKLESERLMKELQEEESLKAAMALQEQLFSSDEFGHDEDTPFHLDHSSQLAQMREKHRRRFEDTMKDSDRQIALNLQSEFDDQHHQVFSPFQDLEENDDLLESFRSESTRINTNRPSLWPGQSPSIYAPEWPGRSNYSNTASGIYTAPNRNTGQSAHRNVNSTTSRGRASSNSDRNSNYSNSSRGGAFNRGTSYGSSQSIGNSRPFFGNSSNITHSSHNSNSRPSVPQRTNSGRDRTIPRRHELDDFGDFDDFIEPGVGSYEELVGLKDVEVSLTPQQISTFPEFRCTTVPKDQMTCAVCLEPFEVGCLMKSTPCAHIFHSQCFDSCFATRKKCPVCFSELVD